MKSGEYIKSGTWPNRQRRCGVAEKVQSIPEARLLLASLRSVGYNEETAIADIIDNCISAQAHEIKIQFDWEKKRIVISDDGFGMSEKELIENMRIGSSDPLDIRAKDDLGRFGMGMKTAAFSLGKKLTVVTKSDFAVSNASWDLDQIPEIGWNLIIRDRNFPRACRQHRACNGRRRRAVPPFHQFQNSHGRRLSRFPSSRRGG